MQPEMCLRTTLFIIMILGASSSSGAVVTVHGSARLTCNKPCSGKVKCVYAKGSEILVSQCKQGSCLHGDAFKDRTELKVSEDGLYLHLNKVEYNDDGMYIFYCDNSELCRTMLDVLVPVLVNTTVGEDMTIPFYARTSKTILDQDIMYRCEKDGELVVELQRGKVSYGPGYKGRVSMSTDNYRKGDVSLSITSVLQSDRGTYHCTHRHEERVHPEAVTLSVSDPTPTPIPAKDIKICCTAGAKKMTWPWWGTLLWTVGLLCALLASYLLFKKWNQNE